MEYNIINGVTTVTSFSIFIISSSSTVMVGDTKTVSLSTAFETPPGVAAVLPGLPTEA